MPQDLTLSQRSENNDASKIDKLEGLAGSVSARECISGRPDERGLHHCVFEVLDNSIDEHLAGFCTKIDVALHVDGSCSIKDNGRGIPVDMHPKFKVPAIELVLTNLHAGGKFGQGAYKYLRRSARRRREMRQRAFAIGSRSRCIATARSTTWRSRGA